MHKSKIYKEQIITRYAVFDVPENAEFLDIQIQDSNLVFWYKFEEGYKATKSFEFQMVWTGQLFDYELGYRYVKTLQHGELVEHIFFRERT